MVGSRSSQKGRLTAPKKPKVRAAEATRIVYGYLSLRRSGDVVLLNGKEVGEHKTLVEYTETAANDSDRRLVIAARNAVRQ